MMLWSALLKRDNMNPLLMSSQIVMFLLSEIGAGCNRRWREGPDGSWIPHPRRVIRNCRMCA